MRRRRQTSEARVLRSESRGGPGNARSQGDEDALSGHQGLPIPEQRGPHKGLIPLPCQCQKSQAVLTTTWGLPSSGCQGTGTSRGMSL